MRAEQAEQGGRLEGWLAAEHLVEHAAQRVHIRASIRLVAGGLLGADVQGRAHDGAGARQVRVAGVGEGAGDAEVGDEGVAVGRKEDVGGLDVTVDHAMCVGEGEGLGHLARDAQRLALDVGHDVVEQAAGLTAVVDGDDVRMGQAGGGMDLAQEAVGGDGGGQLGAKDLDGDAAVVAQVVGAQDGTHGAVRHLCLQGVATLERGAQGAFGDGRQSLLPGGSGVGPATLGSHVASRRDAGGRRRSAPHICSRARRR